MKTILIIEDNVDIHNLLKELLEKEYRIVSAYSGTEALMLLEKKNIDLILLDLILPGLTGEEIISQVKDIPIIVISAKTSPEDKVNVLLNGANDYISKPFDSNELIARIKVQLRLKQVQKSPTLKYKDLTLEENSRFLFIKYQKINLTKTEYAILKQLMLSPNQVISKSKLLDAISNDTLDCDENSLKVHISNIRKKIKSITSDEYVDSVWGIGFKMHN